MQNSDRTMFSNVVITPSIKEKVVHNWTVTGQILQNTWGAEQNVCCSVRTGSWDQQHPSTDCQNRITENNWGTKTVQY